MLPEGLRGAIEKVKPGPAMGKPYSHPTEQSLRVMSYNLLAPSLVKKVDYKGVKEEFITWENRLNQIKREIRWCQPHILCLQESEDKSELHEHLLSIGYEGELYVKPEPSRVDGPATYYDKTRFSLL